MKKMIFKKIFIFCFVFFLSFFLSGCSVRNIVHTTFKPLVEELQKSVLSESHEDISKGSLPFAIKFAEAFYYYYPKSSYYSSKLALLYSAYAFAYVDDGPYSDFDDQATVKSKQSMELYRKAFYYGLLSLDKRIDGFAVNIYEKNLVEGLLEKTKKRDVETLFWFDFAWALMLFEDLSDVKNLAALETIKKIAERIIELDKSYLYGSAYAILCAYYGARTEAIGGDLKKAEEFYEEAKTFSKGNSLVPDYVMMRFVATQQANSKSFDKYYGEIEKFDVTQNKDFAYVNVFLKRKAKNLYKRKKELFF